MRLQGRFLSEHNILGPHVYGKGLEAIKHHQGSNRHYYTQLLQGNAGVDVLSFKQSNLLKHVTYRDKHPPPESWNQFILDPPGWLHLWDKFQATPLSEDDQLQIVADIRACWIGLLNLVILCDHLPRLWATVVVAPLLKPGKARNRLESHRPISLMPLGLKLLDRVLFRRVWPMIQDQALPWQLGGSKGPDLSIAFMGDLLRLRFRHKAPWTVIFLDGQSAFCRPPWLAVVSGMRRAAQSQRASGPQSRQGNGVQVGT